MDTKSMISNKRRKKRHVGEGKDESSSRICDLPDPILQEILSNLPTKDAVRTSILSKRWLGQWKEITKLELEEEAPEKRQQFIDFVGRLLVICDTSFLKKFSLVFEVGEDAPRVNEWLCGFINPNIQELNLDLEGVEQPLVLPDHLFNSATLTEFQLSMQQVLNLPSSIHFKCLKSLTLKHVIFPDTSSTQQLFSSCPSLKELILIDCNWRNVKHVSITLPLLQNLIIREWRDDDDDFDKSDEENDDADGQNVPSHSQIVIVGSSNLKLFSYDGDYINDYFLYCSTSVVDATVEVHPQENRWDAGYFVFNLLKAVPNAKKLSISDFAAKALSDTSFLMVHLPLFHNLVELRVVSVAPMRLSCEALIKILRNSPCLEVIEFVMGVSMSQDRADGIVPLPTCFGTHLNTIKIYGFSGKQEELNAIKILLQAAPVLETLCVYSNIYEFDSPKGSKRLNQLFKQIVHFPRASVDCGIDFEQR